MSAIESQSSLDSGPRDANADLKEHVTGHEDYQGTIESAVNKAARKRTQGTAIQILIGFIIISLGMVAAIQLSVSFGVVAFSNNGLEQAILKRYDILAGIPFYALLLNLLIWLLIVWRGGWFLYNPSVALSGVRGATLHWYDATTDALSENYSSVASGLARSLHISLVTKVQATNLFQYALLSLIVSITSFTSIIFNYLFVPEFKKVVASAVTESFQNFQITALDIFSGGRADNLIEQSYVSLFSPPGNVCWIVFTFIPIASIWVSYQLIRNAIDMRWSLLTSPDTVRRFMYMFVYRRNPDKNFLDEYAWNIAHHYFINNALTQAAEDFVGMDGRLFFYGDDVLDEVTSFASSQGGEN